MKQLTILLFILHISLFTSCQNKSEADDAPYTFQFDGKDYSYKGYEIIPGTEESRVFPLAIGESGLIYYYAYKPGINMGLDQIGYKLDSVMLEGIENIWDKDSLDYSSLPIFDKELPIDKIYNVNFLLKGFKQYNHQYEELNREESDNMKMIGDEVTQFLFGDYTYRIKVFFKQDKKNKSIKHDYYAILGEGDKTHCFFKLSGAADVWGSVDIISSGDFDGDGKIDFVMRLSGDGEKGADIYFLLYLSSEAEEGELVKHVATGVVHQTLELIEGPIGIKGGDIEIRH